MAALTEQPGTRAPDEPIRDRGGTKPEKARGGARLQNRWASRLRKHEQLSYTILAFGIAAASFLAAWRLHGNTSSTYRISSQWGAFTGLFILALAIERALEPFSRKLGPDTTADKDARDKAHADGNGSAAVEHQLTIDRYRRLTAIVTWGVATGLSFLLCAQLNVTLMQSVRASGSGTPPFWADLLVTGLVVGAGTKPLHDLVANIEHAKQSRSPGKRHTR
jgi:hypothetical protein